MKLIYTGPLPGGAVEIAPGTEIRFTRGEPVEVPDSIGAKLRPLKEWKESRETPTRKEKE